MIDKFSTIFDGLRLAYGTFKIEDRNAKGKATGKAMIVREERTEETWQAHLDGTQSVGIIPINEDNMCRSGVRWQRDLPKTDRIEPRPGRRRQLFEHAVLRP